ncbi:7-cyano-7-deazaguanine synthase [Rhodothermus marinus]|uniref:7-cyano-7-deazaguanine synthase n=1 Tax=Rhodothermus marinus TaxID=29549 RepID=UPI000A5137A0|nr:7-cyano-7-deazaguanine synthase [Rhodothermus marinus]
MSAPNLLPTLKPAEHGETALVLLSGGQDSTTCLYWALHYFPKVEAIGFHYGQKHAVELEQARKIAEQAGVPFTVLDLRACCAAAPLPSTIRTSRPPIRWPPICPPRSCPAATRCF